MPKLTGTQYKQVLDTLVGAFPTTVLLGQMVRLHLGENLNAISGEGSLVDITFNLIRWAESRDRLHELIQGAAESNPTNSALQLLAAEFGKSAGSSATGTPPATFTPPGSTPPASFAAVKRRALEERRASLIEDHTALNQQMMHVLDDVQKTRMGRQLEALERDIAAIDADLARLT